MEILAPNLSTMKIIHFYVANYKGDLSSVAEAELEFLNTLEYSQDCWSNAISLLRGVERLIIQNRLPMIQSGECFELKRLKHLELTTGYKCSDMFGLASLLKGYPLLETLVLDYAHQREEDASFYDKYKSLPFVFHLPSLQEVKMKNFRRTDTEYHILVRLRSKSAALKKVVVVLAVVEGTSQSTVVLDLTKY